MEAIERHDMTAKEFLEVKWRNHDVEQIGQSHWITTPVLDVWDSDDDDTQLQFETEKPIDRTETPLERQRFISELNEEDDAWWDERVPTTPSRRAAQTTTSQVRTRALATMSSPKPQAALLTGTDT